jgi:hypothetical protein
MISGIAVFTDGPEAPIITSFVVTGSGFSGGTHTPAEHTTTDLIATLSYVDNNSCQDVMTTGTFQMQVAPASTSTCASTNYLDCYEEDNYMGTFTCTTDCSGVEDLDADIVCTFPLEHYIAPGNWIATATISDGTHADVVTTSMFSVATTTALELIDTVLDFGVLELGVTSTEVMTRVRNYGNDAGMGIGVYAQELNCDTGAISADNLGVATSTTATWQAYPIKASGLMQPLQRTLSTQTVSTTEMEGNIYWRLRIPPSGIGGYCSGVVTVVGIAS